VVFEIVIIKAPSAANSSSSKDELHLFLRLVLPPV